MELVPTSSPDHLESLSPAITKGQFTYSPSSESNPLDHAVKATQNDSGLFATIFGLRENIKIQTIQAKASYVMENYELERCVAIQTCDISQKFLPLESDTNVVVMPHSKYLELLEFVNKEFPRVCSKLMSDQKAMLCNKKAYKLNGNVYVRGNGTALYTLTLGETAHGDKLLFKTHCFPTQTSLTILCSLGYTSMSLGNISFTPNPLTVLARDVETLRDWLTFKGQRSTIQLINGGV